ncbi:GNAT family N-acetyltransferase [Rothia nasisuis]|uniref:GNAT family N-acetyltransferase n=1 Tax=Rothia nasisuis TaxID=2109647 RepID=UPI001F02D2A2|nr:GNAT family N-acetyltransferase [Rothia nasisuis]
MELRYWALTDAPHLLSVYRTSSELERQMPALTSEQDARNLIETSYLPAENRAIFCLSDEGRPAGLIGLNFTARSDTGAWDRAWVYYWIADPYRGQGYTKAALTAVCNWALDETSPAATSPVLDTGLLASLPSPRLRRLELGYRTNNPASGAVAAAAGFQIEGIEREKFLYAGQTYDAVLAARLRKDGRAPASLCHQEAVFRPGFHHVELWTESLETALPSWGWLTQQLGWTTYQEWPGGISWQAPDGSYLVLEESPDTSGSHDRTHAGLNHLAFTAPSATFEIELVAPNPRT